MNLNIPNPEGDRKRIVVVGGGFAGITLVKSLITVGAQIVLLDKNNFHQFPPLLYQVATSGLEPTAIAFPIRKIFRNRQNFYFRMCSVTEINTQKQEVYTSEGSISYDYLVLSAGTTTNYFGNSNIATNALPLKSVQEALSIRNHLLTKMEKAAQNNDEERRKTLMSVAIVGGGPTGVELAGALAELRNHIFPSDYPQMDFSEMKIFLVSASPRLLETFHPSLSERAYKDLVKLGVDLIVGEKVTDYKNNIVTYGIDEKELSVATLIWASGVVANCFKGFDSQLISRAGRIRVDGYNRVLGSTNIYAIGDIAIMEGKNHPQVAQVAIQQAKNVARNMNRERKNKPQREFHYFDKGSMATIGRNSAIAEVKNLRFHGFIAWVLWLVIHLLYILGSHNKITVFIDWAWGYLTFDRPLRTIISNNDTDQKQKNQETV